MELALFGDIQALAGVGSEAVVAVTGTSVEICDAVSLKTLSLPYKSQGDIKALACSPCGLILAILDYESIHVFRRKAKEERFEEALEVETMGKKLLWTHTFGLVCYSGESTLLIDSSLTVSRIDVLMSSVAEVDSQLVYSDAKSDIWRHNTIEAEKCNCTGIVLGCVNSCAIILHGKEVSLLRRNGTFSTVTTDIEEAACVGMGKSHNGLVALQQSQGILMVDQSPALALFSREISAMSPSLTTTPHFSTEPFEFDNVSKPILPQDILRDLSEMSSLPLIERREKQAKLRGDLDEMRFWTLIKQHESTIRKAIPMKTQDISVVSSLSLDTVRRSASRGTPKSTSRSRGKKDNPILAKKPTKASQSQHTKNSFSTPVRSKAVVKPALSKKQPTTRSTSRLQTVSHSEKKIRPENDVFKLAMDTSALLKTCFDSNKKRQPLASDGESQTVDLLLDYSELEGSCKSESPSPCRKRSESQSLSENIVVTDKAGTLVVGNSGVVCRELLGTGPEKPDFTANIFKACVFASCISASFHQAIMYEAAQRLAECGQISEAVELLCASGRHHEACSLLQTHQKWHDSLLLARRFLSEMDVKTLVTKWVTSLCEQKQFLEAAQVSIEEGQWPLVSDVLQKWGKGELASAYCKFYADTIESPTV